MGTRHHPVEPRCLQFIHAETRCSIHSTDYSTCQLHYSTVPLACLHPYTHGSLTVCLPVKIVNNRVHSAATTTVAREHGIVIRVLKRL